MRFRSYVDEVFEALGINDFNERGFTGKGIKYLELESPTSSHGKNVVEVFKKALPDAHVELRSGGIITDGDDISPRSGLIKVIDYAIENNFNIIGASIGGSNNKGVQRELKRFVDNGGIFITSAGNEDEDIDNTRTYANTEIAISCGACIWKEKMKYIRRKSYSNYGIDLDFTLPIITLVEGTSFTQPFLAKIVAMVIEAKGIKLGNPKNQENMYRLLQRLSFDLGEGGFDIYYGHGMPVLNYDEVMNFEWEGESSMTPKDFFYDDNGKWYERFNNRLAELGIINGYGDGTVRADQCPTRGEINKIMCATIDVMSEMIDERLKK